jgi:hypothetical protein
MRSASAAEWILSLVTSQDRVASTIGDLVEEASTRGVFWFWSGVLRTAYSHVWRDLCDYPLKTLLLAVWGFLADFVVSLLPGLVAILFVRVDVYQPGGGMSMPSPWALSIASVVACTAVPFLVGWEVARRSDGRELATALAVVALFAAPFALTMYFWAKGLPGTGPPWLILEHEVTAICPHALFVIAGAILFRRRTHAGRKSVC